MRCTNINPRIAMISIFALSIITMVTMCIPRQRCIPHDQLVELYGRPDGCDNAHLILHCSNPHLDYLHDPQVLNSCGLSQSSSHVIFFLILLSECFVHIIIYHILNMVIPSQNAINMLFLMKFASNISFVRSSCL